MKKVIKLLSMVFVMLLLIISGEGCRVFAQDNVNSIRINKEVLTFDKIIYVDSDYGTDSTGDGSEENPFATVNKAVNQCSTAGSAIFVKGITKDTEINLQNKNVSIIGDYLNYNSKIQCGIYHGCVNIYGMYLMNSNTYAWAETFAYIDRANLYNCIFEEHSGYDNVYAYNITFNNCLILRQGSVWNKTSYVNCAFVASMQTKTSGDGQLNVGVNNLNYVSYDNKFNITSGGWRKSDGKQADIGVYGGAFAWGNDFVEVLNEKKKVLQVELDKKNADTNDLVTANLYIANVEDIKAEDITVTFDADKMMYLGLESDTNTKVLKCKSSNGQIHLVCKRESGINSRQLILKLKFKAIQQGKGIIKVSNCDLSSFKAKIISLEKNECGRDILIIR